MRATPVACLVLMDPNGFFLATRRPEGKSLGGLWEFPGGKIEIDETAEQALRRELIEELTLVVGPLSPLKRITHSYDFGRIELIPFLARCVERPAIRLLEHSAFVWVTQNEAMSLNWAPADLPIISHIPATA